MNRQLDEELIRLTEARYDEAWKDEDIDGILECFTEDAMLISPRGEIAAGTEEFRNLFEDFLLNEAKDTQHTSLISRIIFITNDVAVVDGEAFIENAKNLTLNDTRHNFTDILVRRGDNWLISQIRTYILLKK